MSVISAIFGSPPRPSEKDAVSWLLDFSSGIGASRDTRAGVVIDHEKAYSLPEYWACIRNISEDVAKLPFKTFRRMRPRGKEEAREHPVYRVLQDAPNPRMTAMTFRETLTQWALGYGNGFAEIMRGSGGIELWPIHPVFVQLDRDKDGEMFYRVKVSASEDVRVDMQDMFHLRGMGTGLWGHSVLEFAAESLGLGLAQQDYAASFYGNGAVPSGVITAPGAQDENKRRQLREGWMKTHSGSNQRSPAILWGGMTYQTISVNPQDAQFLETRTFSVNSFARWFRMPPHKIQELTHATFSNIEQENIAYATDTITPWLVRWEQEANMKLFSLSERGTMFTKHNMIALLRGDQETRAKFYAERFRIGSLSVNDIRELEDENPIEGGDSYFVLNQMVPLAMAAEGAGSIQPVNQAKTRGAFMALLVDELKLLDRKERRAIGKAVKKPSPEKAVDTFYSQHVIQVYESSVRILQRFVDVAYGGAVDFEAVERAANFGGIVNAWYKKHGDEARKGFLPEWRDPESRAGEILDHCEHVACSVCDSRRELGPVGAGRSR